MDIVKPAQVPEPMQLASPSASCSPEDEDNVANIDFSESIRRLEVRVYERTEH
jgi:hypothetical protein